jgi:hypothetical protein
MADIDTPDLEELAEQSKGRFGKIGAILIACYAVVLAVCSLGGNNASNDMMRAQIDMADRYAFAQSKNTRAHLYEVQAELLELKLKTDPGLSTEAKAEVEKLKKRFVEQERKQTADKEEQRKNALAFQEERDLNLRRGPYFDFAEVGLQIAVVIASIALLTSSRPLLGISLVLAVIGLALTINGFGLLVKIPYLEPNLSAG